jgi:hypothetical protein
MFKLYVGRYNQDSNIRVDDKGLWEFRCKLQYEDHRVSVVNNDDDKSLLVSWNKDLVEEEATTH